MPVRIVVRLDSSVRIGTGHLMRCLTLADVLRQNGVGVIFACRPLPGNMMSLIEARGHTLRTLPGDDPRDQVEDLLPDWEKDAAGMAGILNDIGTVDWLIVDHYGLDYRWERTIRPLVHRIMAIDDLANRRHECDLLLDQNLHPNQAGRYDKLIPYHCLRLLGPHYALLRQEFQVARAGLQTRDGAVRRLLIFFGGTDTNSETAKALAAIPALDKPHIEVDVIIGPGNPNLAKIRSLCARHPHIHLHRNPRNIAEIIRKADLAVGAAGATTWERCCIGLPSVVITQAMNQESVAHALAENRLAVYLGTSESVTADMIAAAIDNLMDDPGRVRAMSHACTYLVDARGTERVARLLDSHRIVLRPAHRGDCDALHRWRNAEETRHHSRQPGPIPLHRHRQWFDEILRDPGRALLIGERDRQPVGVLRYDCEAKRCTVSVYLVPGQGGHGYGPRLLQAGHEWLRRNRAEVTLVRAEILESNRASSNAFLQAGYRRQGDAYIKDLD